jgi:hypothetical protein
MFDSGVSNSPEAECSGSSFQSWASCGWSCSRMLPLLDTATAAARQGAVVGQSELHGRTLVRNVAGGWCQGPC